MSELEEKLIGQMRYLKLPVADREVRFHPTRRWKFDLCYPEKMIAIEVEGGTYTGGRHTRPIGFENDCRKYSEAALLGWKVIRVTRGMIDSWEALDLVARALGVTCPSIPSGLQVGTLRSGKAGSLGSKKQTPLRSRAPRTK